MIHMVRCGLLALCLLFAPCAWGAVFLAAGDMTPAWRIAEPTVVYGDDAIDQLLTYDAFIWNCETSGPATRTKPNQYVFITDEARLRPLLLSNSIAVVANNHVLDGYTEGANQLLDILNRHMIPYAGLAREKYRGVDSARAACVQQRLHLEDRQLFVFAGSPMLPAHISDTLSVPRVSDIAEAIRSIRVADRDSIVLVYLHDGLETEWAITPRQIRAAEQLAAAGADAVLFSHSHVHLPVEYIGNTLVAWGLGNAVFGGNMAWRNRMLYFLELRIPAGQLYAQPGTGPTRVSASWKAFYTYNWQLHIATP